MYVHMHTCTYIDLHKHTYTYIHNVYMYRSVRAGKDGKNGGKNTEITKGQK